MAVGLLDRAREYASSCNVELLVIEDLGFSGYVYFIREPLAVLLIDVWTAADATCGDVVYRGCQTIAEARGLAINIHQAVPRILTS